MATPVISAEPFFTGSKNKVSISCETDGATIYYTTDGSMPTDAPSRYEKPFCIANSCTVKAMAVRAGFKDSDVVEMCMVRKWSILTETQTTDVPVPYDWLKARCCGVVDEYDSYEKVAKEMALNKRLTVEKCHVGGVDPESPTNDFMVALTLIDGAADVSWSPDMKEERKYKIWGSTNLVDGGDWECPTNATHRFFRVTVEMP